MNVSPSDREIISTRVVNFPRELVFEAWSNPVHLAKWWGPKGFSNTFQQFEFKPGGVWKFVMHSPDGKNYDNKIVFVEIVKPERIVLDHLSCAGSKVTVTFEALAGKTRIVFRQLFQTVADYHAIKGVAIPSNEENFDRIETVLATLDPTIKA